MNNETLVKRIQCGELDQMEVLYEQNRGLIYQVAKKYSGMEELEDLMQQAYFGLHQAAIKYQPEVGAAFTTYAVYWIRESLRSYLKHCGRREAVSIQMQGRYYRYEQLRRLFEQTKGREPNQKEVKDYLGVTEKQLKDLYRNRDSYLVSLEAAAEESSGNWPAREEDPYQEILDQIAAQEIHHQINKELAATLQEAQKKTISLRMFQGLTLAQTAKQMGISEGKVRSLQEQAFRKLKRNPELRRCAKDLGVL